MCYLLEVSPASLVVLAIRLALFFIVTRARAKTHAWSWWRLASAGHKSSRLVLIYFGRTLLDMVTMCDLHVFIVVLAVGLALSLHCDKLASNLIICLAWPHESWIFFFCKTLSDVVAICTS